MEDYILEIGVAIMCVVSVIGMHYISDGGIK